MKKSTSYFNRIVRRRSRTLMIVGASLMATPLSSCWGSDIAKRFRDAYAPGATAGLATAVLTPGDWETGLRQAFAALFEGLGAVIQTRIDGN